MDYIYSSDEPKQVETKNHLGQKQRTINFHIEKTEETREETGCEYRYHSVTLAPGEWGYNAIVAALIKYRFTDDEREAIVNNYLADPRADTAIAEMEALQQWRTEAKQIAQLALKEI